MIRMFIILSMISLVFSCKKDNVEKPPEINQNDLQVIWEYSFENISLENVSISPILWNNSVLASKYEINSNENDLLLSFDKASGSINWTWEDFIRPAPQSIRGKSKIHLIGSNLYACSSQDNYSINLLDGTTIWATDNDNGSKRTSLFEDLLFHSESYGTLPYSDSTNVLVTNVNDGSWRKVFGIQKTDDFEVYFEAPSAYINAEGDTLIIMQDRAARINPFEEKCDLYCYNQTADSLVWVKYDFTSSGSSNVQPPIVEGDRLYFGGKWDVVCLELPSGDEVWRKNLYWDFQGSNNLIHEDLWITNLDNGDLIALNKYTGEIAWVNEDLSYCCTELRVYDDRIYFGNNDLYIVDVFTGDLLHKFSSPNPNGEFYNAVAVDLENKRMYCSDGYSLLCMDVPD